MTKGVITSVLGEAEYNVRLEYDLTQAKKISDKLKQKLIDLVQPILELELKLIQINQEIAQEFVKINDLINQAEIEERLVTYEESKGLLARIAELRLEKINITSQLLTLKTERTSVAVHKTSLDQRIASFSNLAPSAFFCADYLLRMS